MINQLFDRTILDDKDIHVIKTNEFPESKGVQKPGPANLTYNSKERFIDLKYYLDDARFSASDKLQFIKDAMADTTRDAFENVAGWSINFWRSSTEATELINDYFKRKEFEKAPDARTRYKYFSFKTKNLYPEAVGLIEDYFRKRPELTDKYYDEADLIYRLILLGKEEVALNYFELLVNDLVHDTQTFHPGHRNVGLHQGNVFDHLCFSENDQIAARATSLLFRFLNEKYNGGDELDRLAAYLNKEKYEQMLDKWYAYFSELDFSAIDPNELKKKPWERPANSLANRFLQYRGFMIAHAGYLAQKSGKKLWEDFLGISKYLNQNSESFQDAQMTILQNLFRNSSLTNAVRKEMLFQAIKGAPIFKHMRRSWYLMLILEVYPDHIIPKNEFDQLQLEKLLPYSSPLKIKSDLSSYFSYYRNQDKGKLNKDSLNKLITEVNEFAKKNNLKGFTLTMLEQFFLSLGTVTGCIYNFLTRNNLMVSFDVEGPSSPANFINYFETEFKPVLPARHYNFQIHQLTNVVENGIGNKYYTYQVYVKLNATIYKLEYGEERTDMFNPDGLVKAINLCLKDNGEKVRLVGIETGDQVATFVLMEPAIAKPFLAKYEIHTHAIRYYDDFRMSE